MAICNGCGGVIGRHCFNPRECEWIAEQQAMDDYNNRHIPEPQITCGGMEFQPCEKCDRNFPCYYVEQRKHIEPARKPEHGEDELPF